MSHGIAKNPDAIQGCSIKKKNHFCSDTTWHPPVCIINHKICFCEVDMYYERMTDNEIEEQIKWLQNNLKKDDLDPADRYSYTRDLKKLQLLLNEKDYIKLLLLATEIKTKDESVKTRTQSWNRLKKNLEEYASENDISMKLEDHWGCWRGSYTNDCKIIIHLEKNNRSLFIKKIVDDKNKTIGKYEIVLDKFFDFFSSICQKYYFFDIKEWKDILFIVDWYYKLPTDENIELLKAAIERKKIECAAINKISEINQKTLKSYLDALCAKYKIKNYKIENDNSFCVVNFHLRSYYKIQVRIKYSELAVQLKELEGLLQKALEISSSSLYPSVILNRNLANL